MHKALEGLSPRDAIAAAVMIRGGSNAEASRAAGYKHPNALAPGTAAGKRVRSALARALLRKGVTMDLLAQRHREALDAQVTKHFPMLAYTDPDEGVVIPERNLIDYGERRQAVELGYRAFGALSKDAPEEQRERGKVVSIIFEVDAGDEQLEQRPHRITAGVKMTTEEEAP